MKRLLFAPVIKNLIALNFAAVLILMMTKVALASEPDPAGVPTRLVIPSIALDKEILPVGWTLMIVNGITVGRWDTLENDIAWHNPSARLGQAGNTVLNGHSNIHARVFENLIKVKVNDEIVVFSGEQSFYYLVTEIVMVREKGVSDEQRVENAKLIAPTDDERLTLVTCAGFHASQRLIVIARPMPNFSGDARVEASGPGDSFSPSLSKESANQDEIIVKDTFKNFRHLKFGAIE
jgi:LPXTG-site transpeptidase (sortase) family protein